MSRPIKLLWWSSLSLILLCLVNLVPGEPQDFRVIRVTSNSIDLEWKAPKRDEQSASSNNIKGYEIHYFKVQLRKILLNCSIDRFERRYLNFCDFQVNQSSGGSSEWDPSSSGVGSSSSSGGTQETPIFKRKTNDVNKLKYTLTDLEPNTFYKIQIFAYNKRGDGQRSSPLLVATLDEGPARPQNIRSEIRNDVLVIRWDPPPPPPSSTATSLPSSSSSSRHIDGYLVHFDREKFELDAQATQITFQRPKWGNINF